MRTRARLVEAAKSVFEESGLLEARISDIAERAGMSHGSFYHYFESKEQIFRELAGAQEELLTARGAADEVVSEPLSECDRIRRANRRYLERYRDNGPIMGVIEQSAFGAGQAAPAADQKQGLNFSPRSRAVSAPPSPPSRWR